MNKTLSLKIRKIHDRDIGFYEPKDVAEKIQEARKELKKGIKEETNQLWCLELVEKIFLKHFGRKLLE